LCDEQLKYVVDFEAKVHYIARYYIVFYVVYFSKLECVGGGSLTLSIRQRSRLTEWVGFFVPKIQGIKRSLIFTIV